MLDLCRTIHVYLGEVFPDEEVDWMQLETVTWAFFNMRSAASPALSAKDIGETALPASFHRSFKPPANRPVAERRHALIVKHVTKKPVLQPADVLVYVVPNSTKGLLSRRFGSIEKEPMQFGAAATDGTEFGAEVYVRRARPGSDVAQENLAKRPWDLAKFIWHEIAHVKFSRPRDGKSPARFSNLHRRGGIAAAVLDLSDETDQRGAWITGRNIRDMREWIERERPMWTGGFDVKVNSGPIEI